MLIFDALLLASYHLALLAMTKTDDAITRSRNRKSQAERESRMRSLHDILSHHDLRWDRAGGVAILLSLLGFVVMPVEGGESAERPNIIFCMTDDQGYGDVGYLGHPILKTPELDDMAASGLRLDRFYSASPVCSPTRASVMTGRHPTRIGTFRWGNALRPQERTVATVMRDAGYRTGFFGKWHLGSIRADRPTSPGAHGFDHWYAAPNFYMNNPWMSHNGTPVQLAGEGSMATMELALEFIRENQDSGKPFLVFVWFGSPHTPHQATEELQALYADQPDQLRNYYGEISGVDRAIGRLRRELRELGIAEKTLLMFTSDNGGRPSDGAEHLGLRGQKTQLWEGGIRVPAIIEWPGRIDPRVSEVPASTVDLFPTFLEMSGVPLPTDRPLDGVSLVPLLDDNMETRPRPIGFWDYQKPEAQPMVSDQIVLELKELLDSGRDGEINEGRLHGPDQPWGELDDYPGHAVWMENDWKLHRQPNQTYLLFNLADDRSETTNRISREAERAERMKRELRDWEDSVIHSIRGGDY